MPRSEQPPREAPPQRGIAGRLYAMEARTSQIKDTLDGAIREIIDRTSNAELVRIHHGAVEAAKEAGRMQMLALVIQTLKLKGEPDSEIAKTVDTLDHLGKVRYGYATPMENSD